MEQVHRMIEGNALFVGELLKLLDGNGPGETQAWQFAIPLGIRGVISRRFDGLSDECNQALTVAVGDRQGVRLRSACPNDRQFGR